ncbi:MAG: protein translocase subunit SecD, partial [Verrucomicrobiales bacterium]
MNRNTTWKWLAVILLTAWAIWEFTPPTSRNLISQFEASAERKDTNFTAIVQSARELEKARPTMEYANLRDAVGTNDITKYFASWQKAVANPNPTRAILNRVQKEASGKLKLGLDLQGGTSFLMAVDTSALASGTNDIDRTENKAAALDQAIEVLRKRVDRFGVAEPVIQPAGENRILVQLPGLSEADKEQARITLQKAAFLEFRLVHPNNASLIAQNLVPPGYQKMVTRRTLPNGQDASFTNIVSRKTEQGLTGQFISSAGVTREELSNKPQIWMNFNSEGADIFANITRQNQGRQLAIVLDGEVYSAPNINEPITQGRAVISGDFDLREAYELANVLENPLEAPLKMLSENSVDPSLGKDSITSGIKAALIGIILVSVFMLVYYMVAGLVANVALLLNVILTLGVFCAIDATLTLPGIAGIVLTIGMAVDANVLIYERIREELAAGKSFKGALAAGYNKAFGTIFDSNVTTLIASIILIFFGTGTVKGFGVTLTIGVIISMFTALFVTRLLFDFMVTKGMLTNIKMMNLIKVNKIDFLKIAKPAFAISWALIIIGIGYGLTRGSDAMGVDFKGGDAVRLTYAQKVDVDQLRKTIDDAKIGDVTIQYQEGLDTQRMLQVVTPEGQGETVGKILATKFPDAKFTRVSVDTIGAVIGGEILRTALISAALALFGILVYVAFRYEFSFAVAAVVAILHDVLMTMGWFFLTGRQLNAPVVAALLTIIGFSINDTIVIFDRIREDLKLGGRGTFAEIINRALNQTLSRTIFTSGTVFLSTLSLYLFGGGVINDFAFTFLVGILSGTYSTIYIAS